ncbi:hypothetical protein ACQZV8_10975 [Magnetococcales bacterium HHB-1]
MFRGGAKLLPALSLVLLALYMRGEKLLSSIKKFQRFLAFYFSRYTLFYFDRSALFMSLFYVVMLFFTGVASAITLYIAIVFFVSHIFDGNLNRPGLLFASVVLLLTVVRYISQRVGREKSELISYIIVVFVVVGLTYTLWDSSVPLLSALFPEVTFSRIEILTQGISFPTSISPYIVSMVFFFFGEIVLLNEAKKQKKLILEGGRVKNDAAEEDIYFSHPLLKKIYGRVIYDFVQKELSKHFLVESGLRLNVRLLIVHVDHELLSRLDAFFSAPELFGTYKDRVEIIYLAETLGGGRFFHDYKNIKGRICVSLERFTHAFLLVNKKVIIFKPKHDPEQDWLFSLEEWGASGFFSNDNYIFSKYKRTFNRIKKTVVGNCSFALQKREG